MKQALLVTTKASEPEKVDAYMKKLKHPLSDAVHYLRKLQTVPNSFVDISEIRGQ